MGDKDWIFTCAPVRPFVCLSRNFNLASRMHTLRQIILKLDMYVACDEFYILSNFEATMSKVKVTGTWLK